MIRWFANTGTAWCQALAITVLTALLLGMLVLPARATDISTTPHITLAGHYGYAVTGGTLRASDNNTDACALLSGNTGTSVDAGTDSATLSGIPAGASIVGAYLYYAGDGDTPDYTVNLNGTSVTAQVPYSATLDNGGTMNYFGGFINVTNLVTGNGTYSFGGLSVENEDDPNSGAPYCSTQGVVAGWALVVVYQDAAEPLRVINIFDGLERFWGSQIALTPNNFLFRVPASGIAGKFTVITWEGDANIDATKNGLGENLEFNGNQLTDSLNPVNNQYNDTIDDLGTGTSNNWGVDIDTYNVSSYLHAGDRSATTLYSSGQDGVFLAAQVISVANAPVADLALSMQHNGNFVYGHNASYTINIHNNGPSPTSGTTTVTDTLPTGLTFVSGTGTGWTCSASGQVVTCTTTSIISDSGNANPITLTVAIGSGAGSTVTNSATVSVDPSIFDNVSSNNTGSDTAALAQPNLSTSTKTVVDKNGGDALPGDVLEYTITLQESAGLAVTGASVTDSMPANVGGLTIVSKPAGSTDSSTTTGGTNGTGEVDISGISVPANGTATIVYDVTIAGGTATGTRIDNTATITNPSGPGATPAAPTITVNQSQVPVSGNKLLYVYDNLSLTRTPQTAAGTGAVSVASNNGSSTWLLTPALAKAITFKAGSTISVNLQVECGTTNNNGNCSSGNSLGFTAALYDQNGATQTQIGTTSAQATFNYTSYTQVTANITSAGAVTVPAGHQLALVITNTTGRNNRPLLVEQYASGNRSTVNLDLSTVINVDSVGTYSNANCTTPVTQNYQKGSTVYLCAKISDPFGAFDVDPTPGGSAPQIAITDSSSTQQTMATMTHVAGLDTASSKTFEYTYSMPTSPLPAVGTWTAKVTAWEGTEGTVNRSGSGTFTVQNPSSDLSTSTKTVVDKNGGDAEPGDVLEYTITLKESAGFAASNVSVTDDMPAHVGNLTVKSKPTGSTDSSTTTGGTNGTGELDITGISVPANGTVTIVYDVTIASGTAIGTQINNTASIDNPQGIGGTPAAPTVTVAQSQVPASGNKLLYLYGTQVMTRTPPTSDTVDVSIDYGTPKTWAMTTALAKPLTIKANSTISVSLLVQCGQQYQGSCYGNPQWTAALYDNTVSAASQIGSTSPAASFNHGSFTQETADIAVGSSAVTVPAGHELILQITNQNSTNIPPYTTMQVAQYAGGSLSTVKLDVSTVINVDSVKTYANANCTGSPITPIYETASKVYICAVVSDPFGNYDIDPATGGTAPTITITDADNTQQLTSSSMVQPTPPITTAATKTFEYTYTVPTSPPAVLALGHWTPKVTAWEGTEHTISDAANGDFDVEAPNLVVVKSVSAISDPIEGTTRPKALPGAMMRYSILITNQGMGAVDANQLKVSDAIPAHTAFVVGSVTGADSSGGNSGLTALTASDISYSKTGSSTCADAYTPTAGSNGTDPSVTDICFAPTGGMNGKTSTTAPAYGITFEVRIQ